MIKHISTFKWTKKQSIGIGLEVHGKLRMPWRLSKMSKSLIQRFATFWETHRTPIVVSYHQYLNGPWSSVWRYSLYLLKFTNSPNPTDSNPIHSPVVSHFETGAGAKRTAPRLTAPPSAWKASPAVAQDAQSRGLAQRMWATVWCGWSWLDRGNISWR